MKRRNLVILGHILLGLTSGLHASTFTFSSIEITSSDQILLPTGMTTVVQAVNVGDTHEANINGITFAADSNLPDSSQDYYGEISGKASPWFSSPANAGIRFLSHKSSKFNKQSI